MTRIYNIADVKPKSLMPFLLALIILLTFALSNLTNQANAAKASVAGAGSAVNDAKQDSNPSPDNALFSLPKFPDSASYSDGDGGVGGVGGANAGEAGGDAEQKQSISDKISETFNENYGALKAGASSTLVDIEGGLARFGKTMSNDKPIVGKFFDTGDLEVRLEIGGYGGFGANLYIISQVGSYGSLSNMAINTGGFLGFSVRDRKRNLYLATLINGGADFIGSNEPYVAAQYIDVSSDKVENLYGKLKNPDNSNYDYYSNQAYTDSYTYSLQTALSQSRLSTTQTSSSSYSSMHDPQQVYRNISAPNGAGDPLVINHQMNYSHSTAKITEEQVLNKLNDIVNKTTDTLNKVIAFYTDNPQYNKYPKYTDLFNKILGFVSKIQGIAYSAAYSINTDQGKIYNFFNNNPSGVSNQQHLFVNVWDKNGSGFQFNVNSNSFGNFGLVNRYGDVWMYVPQYDNLIMTENNAKKLYYTNKYNQEMTFGGKGFQSANSNDLTYSNHMKSITLPHQAVYAQPMNPSTLPAGESGYMAALNSTSIASGWHGGHRHTMIAERDIDFKYVNTSATSATLYITGTTTFNNVGGSLKQTDNGEHTITKSPPPMHEKYTGMYHQTDGQHIQTVTVHHDNAINVTHSVNSSDQAVQTLSPNANHTTITISQASNPLNTQNGIRGVSGDVSVNQRVGLLNDKLTFKDTQFIPYAVGTFGTAFGNSINPFFGEGLGMLASFDYYSSAKVGVFFETSAIQMVGTGVEVGMTGIGVGARLGVQFGL